MNASPYDVLKRYWGYSTFRPLQEEIIDTVLSDRDCVHCYRPGGANPFASSTRNGEGWPNFGNLPSDCFDE